MQTKTFFSIFYSNGKYQIAFKSITSTKDVVCMDKCHSVLVQVCEL